MIITTLELSSTKETNHTMSKVVEWEPINEGSQGSKLKVFVVRNKRLSVRTRHFYEGVMNTGQSQVSKEETEGDREW